MEFLWVGNHPGVDLCNTVPVVGGEAVELLAEPGDLRRWLASVHPSPCSGDEQPSWSTLAWVHRLRQALRAVLAAGADRHDELGGLNAILGELAAAPFVEGLGKLELHSADPQEQIRLCVASLAIDACALSPDRVRQCANRRCVLLFHDVSKNGGRRWHDMATCGNQAKATAHHARIKSANTNRPPAVRR
jgi:predicted RNA-binding Zn ribbon-like protein